MLDDLLDLALLFEVGEGLAGVVELADLVLDGLGLVDAGTDILTDGDEGGALLLEVADPGVAKSDGAAMRDTSEILHLGRSGD